MSNQQFCEQCGARLTEGARFCEACGQPIGQSGEPAKTVPAQPAIQAPPGSVVDPGQQSATSLKPVLLKISGAVIAALIAAGGWWYSQHGGNDSTAPDQGPSAGAAGAEPSPPPAPTNGSAPPLVETETVRPPAPEPAPSAPVDPPSPPVAATPEPTPPAPPAPVEPSSPPVAAIPEPTPPVVADVPADPPSRPPGLFANGDFSGAVSGEIEGDGQLSAVKGNPAWQLTGPDDMAISQVLKPTPGQGKIVTGCRVLIPGTTKTDAQLGGVRIRFRLTDRYESSAVADRVLLASQEWQTVEHEFEDTASGPYLFMVEAFGFEGPLYLDDIDARMAGGETPAISHSGASDPGKETPADTPTPEEPELSELEAWVTGQAWFKKLAESMPAGVTLGVQETESEFEGWGAFEIREFHSAESGFDPNVAPMVGMFQVSPDKSGLSWFDAVNAEWQPIEDFLASREIE